MDYNSNTECIICFEECTSDDNYMKTRIVNDLSGNVNITICNCNYNLHKACYLEYIKKFGMTCMVCKKNYVSYKYILQQNMNNEYVGVNDHVNSEAIVGVNYEASSGPRQVVNYVGYSQSECQRIICFFICFFICIFVFTCIYTLYLLFFS